MSMSEWQCVTCGEWIDMDVARHVHMKRIELTLDEMIALREQGRDEDAAPTMHFSTELWTPEHKRRAKSHD